MGTSHKGRHFGGQSVESLRSKHQNLLKMVNFCAVYGCSNRSNREKNRSFFRIPAIIYHSDEKTKTLSRERRQRWLAMIQRQDLTDSQIVSTRICSDHFISGKPSALYDTSNIDWLPTLNIGTNFDRRYRKGTYSRIKQRGEKRQRTDTAETLLHLSHPAPVPILALPIVTLKEEDDDRPFKSCEAMTCVTMSDIERLERENFNLREENRELTAKLRTLMRLAMVTNRDKILGPPMPHSHLIPKLPTSVSKSVPVLLMSDNQQVRELPLSDDQQVRELQIPDNQSVCEIPMPDNQEVCELKTSDNQPVPELPMSDNQQECELQTSYNQPVPAELPTSDNQQVSELQISDNQPVLELPTSDNQQVRELQISDNQPVLDHELPMSDNQKVCELQTADNQPVHKLPISDTQPVPELHQ